MIRTYRLYGQKGRSVWSAPVLGLLAGGLLGCGGLLDTTNPNNVPIEAIQDPTAGAALTNGALRQVGFGVAAVHLVYATATDELDWVGSRDGWRELAQGKFSNGYNEFTDASMPNLAEGRWLADEAIKTLEAQQTAGSLVSPLDLAKGYMWGALAYITIADMFDDWALSDKRTSAAPVGQAAMGGFYDVAIGYLTKAVPLAGTLASSNALAVQVRGMRARANFSRAIWDLVGQRPISANRMVSGASSYVTAAVADAQAVLANVPSADWTFKLNWSAATGEPDHSAWIQQRQEMRIGRVYAQPSATAPTWLDNTVLLDPINTTTKAAVVDATQKAYKVRYSSYTVASAREMHLILAEAALQGAATGGTFTSHINNLRAIDAGLTAFSGQITDEAMLVYSRQANLYLQGRRLADHYRFRLAAPDWLPGSQGLSGGWFFPITARECLANSEITAAGCST
ncbi:MAG TPA: hypothetical protein VF970_04580 [Gemmatimonadales bacterium]